MFEARTVQGDCPIQLKFHHIHNLDTPNNRFDYADGVCAPVRCRYDSLRLLEPEAILEARLQALSSDAIRRPARVAHPRRLRDRS